MKKHYLILHLFYPFFRQLFLDCQFNRELIFKHKLKFLLFFISSALFAQPPHKFTANGSLVVPAGITQVTVEAWGAGGAGGGASGASLTTGRSAGGGGGGAYAKSDITVVAGTTLNAVVALPTTGTALDGASGGFSTIQGFETSIMALGGLGGYANTTGNQPAGGAGGSYSSSIGNVTKTVGGAGDPGNFVLVSALLSSGKGGSSPGGGAGGAAASTLILGSFPGNAGANPGGGGSGAINSAGAAAQLGGAGARGEVIVTYTCPTYHISGSETAGVSAADVCATTGTSEVTITALATSLPTGVYTVTYGRGIPITTTGQATMTVTTAGTGKFTATGFTTVGSSRVTVTNLTSGVCSSNVNNHSTVTIYGATVGGTVSGGTTICSGSTSAALSLTGNTGSVVKWQSLANSSSTWVDIIDTTATHTSGILTETTQFRAVIKNGACDAVNSTATTVTVNPLPQGTLSANGPFCGSGTAQLTFNASAGTGPFTIVYTENGGANRTATNVTNNTAFAAFTNTVTTNTTYNIISVTDQHCTRTTGFTTGSATITVNPLPQGTLSANGPFCGSGTAQLTFNASAGTGPFTIVYTENGGANRTATNVTSNTAFAAFTNTVTTNTTYNIISVTDQHCTRTTGFTTGSATITVNPLPQGTLSANGPFCGSGTAQLTFNASAGTGPFTIVYTENGGANRTATNVTSNTAFAAFTNTVTTNTTYNIISVTDQHCTRTTGFTTGSATITVNPLPQGTLSANGPFCGSGTAQLTFNASAGTGPFTIVYTENGGANRTATNVTNNTAFTAFTNTISSNTTYALVSVTDVNCTRTTGFTTGSATITVNPLPQGTLSANGPFCGSGTAQLTFNASAGTGPFTIVYTENGGANRTATNVTNNTAFTAFTNTISSNTTYALVSVTDVNCTRTTGFTTGSATITVNPLPQGSLSANGPFCGSGTAQLTFNASAGTGPFTIVYTENGGANRTATNVTNNTAFTAFTNTVSSNTTYTLVSVTDVNCTRTTGFTTGSATIIVNPLPQGSLSANGPFCGSGTAQLTFNASAGTGPFTIVYTENGGANRTATNVTNNTAFTAFTNTISSNTTYALVSVTDVNCTRTTGFTTGSATITVNPLPQGTLSANGPFCGSGTAQLTFNASAGTGPFTIVYTENGGANRTATNVTNNTAFTAFTNIVSSNTTYALVSVTDQHCTRTTGFTTGSATITVNPLPQGTLSANGPFCGSGTAQLTFNASAGTGPFTIVYTENGGANRTATNVTNNTAFTAFTNTVSSNTTYTLVSVTDVNCTRTTGFTTGSATIMVNPLPQGSLSANGPFCGSGTAQLTFNASAGTGPFTIVYTENGGANRTATNVTNNTAFTAFTNTISSNTTYALVSVTDVNCTRTTGFTTGSATITVNSLPQGTLSANGPFCGSGTAQLTFNASAGTGPFTIVYTENGGANRTATNVTNNTAFTAFTNTISSNTTYALVSVTDQHCTRTTGFTTGSATITVNPLPQGTLSANGPFCGNGTAQLTFNASAGTGPFTIVYTENGGANRTATNVTNNTAFTAFTNTISSNTTYALVSVTDVNCTRTTGFTTGSATITVNSIPIPVFSIQPGASVCVNTDITYETLAGQTNYLWTVPGTVGTDYNITSGGISTTNNSVTLQWLTTGNKTVSVKYSSNGCVASTSASNTTNVTKTERGVVHGGLHICSGNPSPLLTLDSYVGTIVRWEYAEAIPYVWQPIANTTNTYQPGTLTNSTSYRAVVKNGTCSEEFSIETRIDIDSGPPAPNLVTVQQPTCNVPTGSIVLNGLTGSGNLLQNDGTTISSHAFSGSSITISGLAVGKYKFAVDNSCSLVYSVEISIQPNIWNGSTWSYGGSGPTLDDFVDFQGSYALANDINACSCTISNGASVAIAYGKTLTVTNGVHVVNGSLTFSDGSSLLQTTTDNNLNTGNIIYKRNSQPIRQTDYTYWSSPVKSLTLFDLSPLTEDDKYYSFDGTQWVYAQRSDIMKVGKGYILRGPETFSNTVRTPYPAVFKGVPNNGTIAGETVDANKYYLIGNPYPSALNANDFITGNSILEGTLYFWTHNTPTSLGGVYRYSTDDYATYNLSGGVGTGTPAPSSNNPVNQNNNSAPNGNIAAGQSFFAGTISSGVITFNNTMRRGGNTNSQFYKPGSESNTTIVRDRLWLNMTNTEGAFKQMLVAYVEGATNDYDRRYDGDSFDGNKFLDFYSLNNNHKLVIQGRAVPLLLTDVVPLGYRTTIAGDFTIAIDHTDGNMSMRAIYLEDKVTGVIKDLRDGNYTFTSEIGTFANRFVLKYTNKTLGTDEFENTKDEIIVSVKDKKIKVESTKENIDEVSVYSMSGSLVFNKKNINATELQISNLQLHDQVLLVKVILENKKERTKKIIF